MWRAEDPPSLQVPAEEVPGHREHAGAILPAGFRSAAWLFPHLHPERPHAESDAATSSASTNRMVGVTGAL